MVVFLRVSLQNDKQRVPSRNLWWLCFWAPLSAHLGLQKIPARKPKSQSGTPSVRTQLSTRFRTLEESPIHKPKATSWATCYIWVCFCSGLPDWRFSFWLPLKPPKKGGYHQTRHTHWPTKAILQTDFGLLWASNSNMGRGNT